MPGVLPPGAWSMGRGWNGQLCRVLGNLGAQAGIGIPTLGTDLITRRPLGGYRSIAQFQEALGTSKDLSPYLTASSWVDRGVVHPNAYAAQGCEWCASEVKKRRKPLRLEEEGRPPVNLNAAPRAVLVALLRNLRGATYQYRLSPGAIPLAYTLGPGLDEAVADRIVAARQASPFSTWRDFEAFCESLVTEVPSVFDPVLTGGNIGPGRVAMADLLKANFNPNTQLAKDGPDQLVWKWIDKSDLLAWSTEGSLGPTGSFRVSAVGRVLGRDGILLAERVLGVTVEAFNFLRQSSQKDFVAGRLLIDLPDSPRYLSLATAPLVRTTGASAAAWLPGAAAGQGVGAMTYPAPPTALPGQASEVDGAVGLATVETDPGDPPDGRLCFLHHMDDGLNADVGAAKNRIAGPSAARIQADVAASLWPDPSLPPPQNEPNTFRPDGFYAQTDRCLAYPAGGPWPTFNFPYYEEYIDEENPPVRDDQAGDYGSIFYWVKRPSSLKHGGGTHAYVDVSIVQKDGAFTPNTAVFAIGRREGFGDSWWGITFENRLSAGPDADASGSFQKLVQHAQPVIREPDMRWHLVAAAFDTDVQVPGQELLFETRGVIGGQGLSAGYPAPYTSDMVTRVGWYGPIVLGGQWWIPQGGSDADQVIDEFAICDFGDLDADTAKVLTQKWADTLYALGRYYKGDDGSFLSIPLQPRPGESVRLVSARWTAYLPKETRLETLPQPPVESQVSIRPVDPLLLKAAIRVDLLDGGGSLLDTLVPGAMIGRTLGDFRYRVTFLPALADPGDDPALETPFFDDITFAWQRMTGPKVLSWERP